MSSSSSSSSSTGAVPGLPELRVRRPGSPGTSAASAASEEERASKRRAVECEHDALASAVEATVAGPGAGKQGREELQPGGRDGGIKRLEDANVTVVHQSSDFLCIDKPADFRLDGDFPVTVEKYVRQRLLPPDVKPKWIHQLDFATSGVLIMGLNRLAAGSAGKLFSSRFTKKFYVALVRGRLRPALSGGDCKAVQGGAAAAPFALPATAALPPSWDRHRCTACTSAAITGTTSASAGNTCDAAVAQPEFRYADGVPVSPVSVTERCVQASVFRADREDQLVGRMTWPFYSDGRRPASDDVLPVYDVTGAIAEPDDKQFRMVIDNAAGREARTQIVPVAYGFAHGQEVTKVLLRPIQGRRHQLRLHCLHLGFPILGDATYGPVFCHHAQEADDAFFMKPPRMYLHALHLELPFEGKFREAKLKHRAKQLEGGNLGDMTLQSPADF